jgi:hypothetical protein
MGIYVDLKTYQPTHLTTKIDIYIFQNIINMPRGIFVLCHVSLSRTIINNHNKRWRSMFQKNNPKNYVQKNS